MDPIDETLPDDFSALGLRPELLASLTGLGYEEPTPIQREAIPPLLAGRDLVALGYEHGLFAVLDSWQG